MVEMRQLEENEKEVANANLKRAKTRIEELTWYKEYHKLMLDKGLEANYKIKCREFETKYKQIVDEEVQIKNTMLILEKQLTEGVEVIKEKEVKEDGTNGNN